MNQAKKGKQLWLALLSVILLLGLREGLLSTAQAGTLHVADNGTDNPACGDRSVPCRSISQAIINASEGDTILVGPGRYGDLNSDGDFDDPGEEAARLDCGTSAAVICIDKRLTVLSTNGAAATVLDAAGASIEGLANVVLITADGVLFGKKHQGFTITGGAHYGLNVQETGNVRITGNSARNNPDIGFILTAAGGGIHAEDNLASGNGTAGFWAQTFGTDQLVLTNNTAVDNPGGGFFVIGNASHQVIGNTASRNGGGFALNGNGFLLKNNTITANGEGIGTGGNFAGGYTIVRNTIVGNQFAGIHFGFDTASSQVHENNIFGNGDFVENCGVINESPNAMNATNNYWGAASGPGPNPADNAGPDSSCDVSGSNTTVEPFAPKQFVIKP
jgi:parallel beta-helix repeat protein